MKVTMLDLVAQYQSIREEIDGAIAEVIASGHFILGPQVQGLEKEMASYCRCSYAVGVASGTDALHLALRACGIGEGDGVITSPFTFIATAEAISYVGARPIFLDIEASSFNLDPNQVEDFLKGRLEAKGACFRFRQKARALLPVHLYGRSADMTAFREIASRHNLAMIEDCAQAIGSEHKGERAGSFGQAGCFSFFPTKNLGGYGDGGMFTTQDPNLAERVRILRQHGSRTRYFHEELGFNSRLDEIQAAILRVKLRHLDAWIEGRRRIADLYRQHLNHGPIVLPQDDPEGRHIYHQFTIRVPQRDALQAYLKEKGIATMIYYPVPLHQQKVYAHLGYEEGDLPQSERAAREVLSLPIYPELPFDQIGLIAEAVRGFYQG
ncbi:MAG: DegT/DnrJ/EryC1/StrS family aminotransferase [candidate division NC10 bacterium]|nr:DegT/DnrJ/EryC1/StrS family aminotransferase [candidate division NC10 bacterium]